MKDMSLIDLHQDLKFGMQHKHIFPENLQDQTSFFSLAESNVRLVVASSFIAPAGTDYSVDTGETNIDELRWYREEADRRGGWMIVRDNEQLGTLFQEGLNKRGLLLHVEGLRDFEDSSDSWKSLERLYEGGMRSLGIMWNGRTTLGSGAYESGGLSDLGRQVLEWCQERGVVVDLSHMNEETFWGAADVLRGPLMVTHVGVRVFCDRKRNITDEQIRKVGETGGVIGIYMTQTLLCSTEETGLSLVVDHMEHVRDLAGGDAVAIGSDFGGIDAKLTINGMTSVAGLPLLLDELEKRGWEREEIERVAWKNAYRVLVETLPKT